MTVRSHQGVTPQLGTRVYVDETALVVGRVTMGDDASLWPMAVARGDVNTIAIGARTNIQDGSVLHVTHDGPYSPGGLPLVIGEDVTVGHRVTLHACTVGDRVLVGMNTVVLDGAIIDDDVLIGAGSLVAPGKRLEAGGLYVGRPARRVRDLTERELENLAYSAAHYVRVKDSYLSD